MYIWVCVCVCVISWLLSHRNLHLNEYLDRNFLNIHFYGNTDYRMTCLDFLITAFFFITEDDRNKSTERGYPIHVKLSAWINKWAVSSLEKRKSLSHFLPLLPLPSIPREYLHNECQYPCIILSYVLSIVAFSLFRWRIFASFKRKLKK